MKPCWELNPSELWGKPSLKRGQSHGKGRFELPSFLAPREFQRQLFNEPFSHPCSVLFTGSSPGPSHGCPPVEIRYKAYQGAGALLEAEVEKSQAHAQNRLQASWQVCGTQLVFQPISPNLPVFVALPLYFYVAVGTSSGYSW